MTPDDLRQAVRNAIAHAELKRELERSQEQFQTSVQQQIRGCIGAFVDITERHQAAAALKASQQRYQELAEAMPQMVWTADATGAVNYWNQRWYDYTGLSPAESMGLEGVNTVHPQERDRTLEKWSQSVANGQCFEIEYRIRRVDGVYHWFISRGIPTKDHQGQITGWIGTITDIDYQKQLEKQLLNEIANHERSEAILQAFIAASPTVLVLFDRELRFLYANEALAKINGLPLSEHIGKTLWDVVPQMAPRFAPLLLEVMETQQPVLNLEFRGEVRPGVFRHTIANHYPVCLPSGEAIGVGVAVMDITNRVIARGRVEYDTNGKAIAFPGVLADITDRKQSEAALRQSEDRLRMAIESAQLGTWDLNLRTNQLIWDVGCKAMFGLPPEAETSLEVFYTGLHPDDRDRLEQIVQDALNPATGGKYDVEYRTIGINDGIERWIRAKGQTYFDAAGHPLRFIGTVLDITEQKCAEAQREQLLQQEQAAREAAERANRIKDEFLAVLSHELRSPLNPILGWTKLLQSRKLDDSKTTEALATIERNVKLQTQLIDDLLDVAKILRGKLSLNLTSVNLSFIIAAAIDTVKTAAIAKSIAIHPILPNIGQVSGDAARLQQIIWNLLSNAVKFTPHGGLVDIQLQKVGDRAEIIVKDTGKGISPDFLPHIFESFRQEDASITRKYGGLGLGLAIVRQLVEAHGGAIAADSPGIGLGATFTVQLPLLNLVTEIQPTEDFFAQKLDLSGIRILTVDDDTDARELLTVLLTQHGAEVVTVTTAAEVLATLELFQPDVLISDIGMPEVDGYTLIQQIRALPPEKGGQIPAIALTAYARIDDYQRALNSGYQRHLTKPLDPEKLVQAAIALTKN